MDAPQITILISTYQRPYHLQRVLASVGMQVGIDQTWEVVVSDDGSTDDTPDIVDRFARKVRFPVRFTTHEHHGFHLARCRNEGVAASTAPYLLFLDGDCLIPPDYVKWHLSRRRFRTVMAADCVRLDRTTTDRVDLNAVREGTYRQWVSAEQRRYIRRMAWRGWWYETILHPTKPKLFGGNLSMWRADYELVNGYDENFRGWGCEDDDLRLRLRQAGVRVQSILRWTHSYHMWHPLADTVPQRWRDGVNVSYLLRNSRPARCERGLDRHSGERHDSEVTGSAA